MGIQLVQKDISIIIGKKAEKQTFELDGVLVYDAYCLSNNTPVLLQSNDLRKLQITDKSIIYLCGHGKKSKKTISGLTMKEIASELNKIGDLTSSKATIMIMACYGKTMEDDLRNALNSETLKVEAYAKHTTLVANYGGYTYIEDKNFMFRNPLFMNCQYMYLKKLGCNRLIVTLRKYKNQLENYYARYALEVEKWNKKHIDKQE